MDGQRNGGIKGEAIELSSEQFRGMDLSLPAMRKAEDRAGFGGENQELSFGHLTFGRSFR